jgi:molybdenum cofactor guanylyltransferase
MTFVGAVLTGGASRRMGVDKATIPVEGVAMAARVAAALRSAGATEVVMVGSPVEGERAVPDDHPGEGPLGGVLTALAWSGPEGVVVAPCDLVAPSPSAFTALADALEGHRDALVAVAGLDEPLPIALRPAAIEALQRAFAGGERSLRRALAGLDPVVVALGPTAVADADTPDELPPGAG